MISIKNPEQTELMRNAGALLHQVLSALKPLVVPGITTRELDAAAEKMIREAGAIPSFKGYGGYPMNICTSINDQVVHGIPGDVTLKEGDIVSIDAGLILHGWQSDSAFTAPVGKTTDAARQLIDVTEKCFFLGVAQMREGNRIGDVSAAIQAYAESFGYGVIRDLCGHGIGREMHEAPDVPNFGMAGTGVRLRAGMTLAIEPMIAMGGWPVYRADDGWTVITKDHSLCSHYEHTVLVTTGEPEILSLPGAKFKGDGR